MRVTSFVILLTLTLGMTGCSTLNGEKERARDDQTFDAKKEATHSATYETMDGERKPETHQNINDSDKAAAHEEMNDPFFHLSDKEKAATEKSK